MSALDAVDGSSTGIQVPDCGVFQEQRMTADGTKQP